MKEMTIRERMLAVYHNKLPDKIPVGIYTRFLSRGSVERELRNMDLGIIDNHPIVSFMAPTWYTLNGFLSEVKNTQIDVKHVWKNGEYLERVTYTTPVGTVYEESRQAAGPGSKCFDKHFISSIEDYKIVQYIVENTVFRSNAKAMEAKIKGLGDDGVVLGRLDRSPYQKLLIELAGIEQFLIDLYTDPDPVEELMQAMDHKFDESFEMASQTPVDVFWQPDNITTDLTPPDMFQKYHMPFYQKHLKKIKATGIPYIIHMDGHIKALQDLVNEVDFHAIESLSFPHIGGDYTFTEAKAAFPGKVLLPNFPSNLSSRSEGEIAEFLKGILDEAGKTTPFMLQISEDIADYDLTKVLRTICTVLNEYGYTNQ